MNALVVYYSRTNVTKKVAEDIQKGLDCDIEEIKELKNYDGAIGFAKGAIESVAKRQPKIETLKNKPQDYDLLIIGSPVWASTMASPVYTYIKENKDNFNKLALFCTCGGSGYESTLKNMAKLSQKEALATFFVTKEILNNNYENQLNEFVEKLKE